MKYSCEITIDRPRARVIELMDNPDNMKHWQPGLISYEFIEGEPGKVGSKMKLNYKMGKREMEMVETITKNNFPSEFDATYEAKGVYNVQLNKFIEIDENTTKWVAESEFRFSGFMSIMSLFMKSAFKKQSFKYLEKFNEFAEGS